MSRSCHAANPRPHRPPSGASMTIGSLFSGIGGLELGLEWAGLGPTLWQVEQNEFCCKALEKHWPDATRHHDVRTVGAANLQPVDVICGGFPCQDVSWAGFGGGLDAARSGLWTEYARIIRELRPAFVIVENVAALLARGLDRVLGDLARIGYDAEWSVLSACSVGAPHVRRRLFIVAYPNGKHGRARIRDSATRAQRSIQALDGAPDSRASWRARMADPSSLYGGADGLPNGMDRNHAVGNAVVPQVGYVVGQVVRRIMETA